MKQAGKASIKNSIRSPKFLITSAAMQAIERKLEEIKKNSSSTEMTGLDISLFKHLK